MRRSLLFSLVALSVSTAACATAKKPVADLASQDPAPAATASAKPATSQPSTAQADQRTRTIVPVYFGYDSALLDTQSREHLELVYGELDDNAGTDLTIEGHSDDRGTTEYNISLGERRAKAAKDYLVRRGVADQRIRIVSYGEEKPAVAGTGEEAWSQNRRDEFVID